MTSKILKCKCDTLDDFGRGIVHIDNQTLFVNNLLPGDEANIKTTYKYGKVFSTSIISFLNKSKDRISPPCPYYSKCGGCNLMHLSYEKQLEFKKEKVHNLIKKISHLDLKINDVIPCTDLSGFRTKVQKPFGLINNKVCLGFYKEGTHKIVCIKKCLIEKELSNNICNTFLSLIKKYNYKIYDEDTKTGSLRHLLIKVSSDAKSALVTLVTKENNLKGIKEFAKELIQIHPEIKGFLLNINPRDTNVILGQKEIPVFGLSYIKDKIFDNVFSISSSSFYQTNSRVVETLYSQVIKLASFSPNDIVLDAYCGTGTIGISCSKYVKKVIGVEINKSSINDAIYNTKRNNIQNCSFILDDATNFILKSKDLFDVIILDPPRKGTTKEFIQACLSKKPNKIIYVSCDVATLSRDLALFNKGYEIKEIQPIDMFPHSYHVECIAGLYRKEWK